MNAHIREGLPPELEAVWKKQLQIASVNGEALGAHTIAKNAVEGRLQALRISRTGSLAILAPEGAEREDDAAGGNIT